MDEEFVPYEEALALKELGFNEACFGRWHMEEQLFIPEIGVKVNRLKCGFISAPLYQQAFRWFRKKYGLIGHLDYGSEFLPMWDITGNQLHSDWENSFEEAELACLRKLIEIVKEL